MKNDRLYYKKADDIPIMDVEDMNNSPIRKVSELQNE